MQSLIESLTKRLCYDISGSDCSRHRWQFCRRHRHSEKAYRQGVKALRISQSPHGSFSQVARQKCVNEGTDLNHPAAHENGKEVMCYLTDMGVRQGKHWAKTMNQTKYGGELNTKLERASNHRSPGGDVL